MRTSPYIAPGERQQHRRELAETLGAVAEVPAAVDHHERADAGDDERHEPRERVHPHRQLDAQRRDPVECLERNISGHDRRRLDRRLDESDDRQQRGDVEGACADARDQPREQDREECERAEEEEHERPPLGRRPTAQRAARAIRVSCSVYRGGARGARRRRGSARRRLAGGVALAEHAREADGCRVAAVEHRRDRLRRRRGPSRSPAARGS